MHPPIRQQSDIINQDTYSLAAGTDCSDMPDMTRQEFAQEADINYILGRFGIGDAPTRQPVYGDQDFDLDLHAGMIAIGEAQRAFVQLPPELHDKYRDTKGMLDAMNSGELARDLQEIATRPSAASQPLDTAADRGAGEQTP